MPVTGVRPLCKELNVPRNTVLLEPQLGDCGILDTVVFQEDGAPPKVAHIVRNYIKRTFPGRWIRRGSPRLWASRSPDLTPLDLFFAWRYIKSKVYTSKVNGLSDLQNCTREAAGLITVQMLKSTLCSTRPTEKWDMCIDLVGSM